MKALYWQPGPDTKPTETNILSWDRSDEMYIRRWDGMVIPAAYVYPIESQEDLQKAIDDYHIQKKAERDWEADFFYSRLAKLRH